MRIYFLLTRRIPDVPDPIVLGAQRLLGRMGHKVTGWIFEDRLLRTNVLAPEADLCVPKSHTELVLSYVDVLHGQGITVYSGYRARLTAQDKMTAERLMRELCMPTPETWFIGSPQQAIGLLAEGPLVIKPHRGHRETGLYPIEETAQLISMRAPLGPPIAQRHVPGSGEDLKAYVAGENVWMVRKPSDSQSFTRLGRPVHVDEEIRGIVARICSGFGLELFGCDVIESPDGPRVVDVNHFPGYKGCPNPVPVIAATIDRVARGS